MATGARIHLAQIGWVRPLPPPEVIPLVPIAAAEVPCSSLPRTRTVGLIVGGQTNAANGSATVPERARPGVYAVHEGRCYAISGPLPGGEGDGTSMWTLLADKIIGQGLADSVILAPAVVGGTVIEAFARGGHHHEKVLAAATDLMRLTMPTAFLWQHGETDGQRGTPEAYYRTYFDSMVAGLRSIGFKGPVLAAKSTRCRPTYSPAVRAVQEGGPDTDVLADLFRSDGCHLNAMGRNAAADLWLQALVAHIAYER